MLSTRLYQGAVLRAEVICRHETQRWIQNDVGGNNYGEF